MQSHLNRKTSCMSYAKELFYVCCLQFAFYSFFLISGYRYEFSELSGNFSSPHYPEPYGNYLDAIWVFNAPVGYNIHVQFVDFYLNYYVDLVRLL